MSPEESRHLKIGQRVSRIESDTDLGTVASVISSGVQIEWDSGITNDYQHKDMQNIRLASE
jgi:hypothetical protein